MKYPLLLAFCVGLVTGCSTEARSEAPTAMDIARGTAHKGMRADTYNPNFKGPPARPAPETHCFVSKITGYTYCNGVLMSN